MINFNLQLMKLDSYQRFSRSVFFQAMLAGSEVKDDAFGEEVFLKFMELCTGALCAYVFVFFCFFIVYCVSVGSCRVVWLYEYVCMRVEGLTLMCNAGRTQPWTPVKKKANGEVFEQSGADGCQLLKAVCEVQGRCAQ